MVNLDLSRKPFPSYFVNTGMRLASAKIEASSFVNRRRTPTDLIDASLVQRVVKTSATASFHKLCYFRFCCIGKGRIILF